MTARLGRSAAVAGGLVAAILAVAATGFAVFGGFTVAELGDSYGLSNLAIGCSLAVVGTILTWNRPSIAIGPLLLAGGIAYLVSAAFLGVVVHGQELPDVIARTAGTLVMAAWSLAIGLFVPLALLLFPTGRLGGAVPTAVAGLVCVNAPLFVAGYALFPPDFPTLFGFDGYDRFGTLWAIGGIANTALYLATVGVLGWRFRHGTARVRGQILWVALALVVVVFSAFPLTLLGLGDHVLLVVFTAIPAAIVIAILRYRLLDIRLAFSRALAWLLLTALVVGVYAGIVALLSGLLAGFASSTVSALVVALAFEPLRRLLQRFVDRLIFGRREPDFVLRSIGGGIAEAGEVGALV